MHPQQIDRPTASVSDKSKIRRRNGRAAEGGRWMELRGGSTETMDRSRRKIRPPAFASASSSSAETPARASYRAAKRSMPPQTAVRRRHRAYRWYSHLADASETAPATASLPFEPLPVDGLDDHQRVRRPARGSLLVFCSNHSPIMNRCVELRTWDRQSDRRVGSQHCLMPPIVGRDM